MSSLFSQNENGMSPPQDKIDALKVSMDRLVQKFGRQSIYLGGAHGSMDTSPMRIAFNHIPDLEIESD